MLKMTVPQVPQNESVYHATYHMEHEQLHSQSNLSQTFHLITLYKWQYASTKTKLLILSDKWSFIQYFYKFIPKSLVWQYAFNRKIYICYMSFYLLYIQYHWSCNWIYAHVTGLRSCRICQFLQVLALACSLYLLIPTPTICEAVDSATGTCKIHVFWFHKVW